MSYATPARPYGSRPYGRRPPYGRPPVYGGNFGAGAAAGAGALGTALGALGGTLGCLLCLAGIGALGLFSCVVAITAYTNQFLTQFKLQSNISGAEQMQFCFVLLFASLVYTILCRIHRS